MNDSINTTQNKEQVIGLMQQMVVFELDKEEYAVPITEVQEVVKIPVITPVPQSPAFILGIINLRGKIVPILDMEKLFKLARENKGISEHIMVTEDGCGNLFGVQVDKVTEVLKISQESIQTTPKMITNKISAEYLKGVAVIKKENSERVLLILDLQKILTAEDLGGIQKAIVSIPNEAISQSAS
jgi:purine-binding chemotaxis protein CheW